ncbi:hypothetical protein LI177_09770, partial [bacterium 210820-DFI.6.37]|nr:hypothetical protein [bacterium 210820-DFI.6.37]
RQEAREEGRKSGIEEGKKAGIEEGRKSGIEEGQKIIAQNLLLKEFGIEEIAEITGLSIEQINQLQSQ